MTARLDETNTHTFFLREADALEAVVKEVADGGSVWSAGCSTGEEVYSLALLAHEHGRRLNITGSDINRAALRIARRARYLERRVRSVDASRRSFTFEQTVDGFEVKEALRSRTFFTRHDIASDQPLRPASGTWDAILCRNVFLYLTADQIDHAIAGFAASLRREGLLFFGASELMSSVLHSHRPRRFGLVLIEIDGAWGYRRTEAAGHSPEPTSVTAPIQPPTSAPEPSTQTELPGPPTDVHGTLRERGDTLLDAGDAAGALDVYRQAMDRDALAADLHLRVAVCQLQSGSTRLAKEALRRALFLEPGLWPAAMLLGDLLEHEDPVAAERHFRHALEALVDTRNSELHLSGSLAPFVAGRRAAVEAVKCRLELLRRTTVPGGSEMSRER